MLVVQEVDCSLLNRIRPQSEVNESRARNRRGVGQISDLEMFQNVCRNVARLFASLLSKHECGIGLIIAKPRIGRWCQLTGVRQPGFGQRIGKSPGKNFLERFQFEEL